MDLSKEIVLDADNFGQLIRPVGAPRLKAMADRMRKLQGKSEATPEFYDLLNFENILETARNFWGGKHALGMAAVVNTHHPKAQKAGLGLNITQDTVDALSLFNHSSIVSNDGGTPYIPLGNRYDANGEHLFI